ncbi:hypothetical protein Anas_00798 [Armadillidium nasatum]|uniref:Uncharacterized protein n=1 Tax=Armadillidium nasatum TaxID=96803 RepID=A0A5N5T256_9CRUS|nr:hypothetical protein Anas_00798 [Armadillidium nasatum]
MKEFQCETCDRTPSIQRNVLITLRRHSPLIRKAGLRIYRYISIDLRSSVFLVERGKLLFEKIKNLEEQYGYFKY